MRYFYVQNGAFDTGSAKKNARILQENLRENFGLRELLMALLDDAGKQRLEDQSKTNDQRFSEYDADLRISFQSTPRQLDYHRWLIAQFRNFLGQFPPTALLAKQFLAGDRFGNLKPRSLDRYYRIIKRFLDRQCGIPLELIIQKTRSLPDEVEVSNVAKLRAAVAAKKTHRDTVERDLLLIDVACLTALRCSELANLKVRDIRFENREIAVKRGKGNKDRNIPVNDNLLSELRRFTDGKQLVDNVFNLNVRTISNKLGGWGRKSGSGLHAHSLRHFSAEQLRNSGADLDVIQDFLGHESPETSRVYMAQDQGRLRRAIEQRDKPKQNEGQLDQHGNQSVKTEESPNRYDDKKDQSQPIGMDRHENEPGILPQPTALLNPELLSLDREHFLKSDQFMDERFFMAFLLTLELHQKYMVKDYTRLMAYFAQMELVSNRFSNVKVEEVFEQFWQPFEALFFMLQLEFSPSPERGNGKDSERELRPAGLRFLNDLERAALIQEKSCQLREIIESCRSRYKAFRMIVRDNFAV